MSKQINDQINDVVVMLVNFLSEEFKNSVTHIYSERDVYTGDILFVLEIDGEIYKHSVPIYKFFDFQENPEYLAATLCIFFKEDIQLKKSM